MRDALNALEKLIDAYGEAEEDTALHGARLAPPEVDES